MNKYLKQFVTSYGKQLCSLALVAAGLLSQGCRMTYYQPKEPDGLLDFARNKG